MSNYSSPPNPPKHRERIAHAKCTFKKHLKADGSVNYAESNFHAITLRPLHGVTNYKIKAMFNQYKLDLIGVAGGAPLAFAGSFGVEGQGENRHVHVALILRHRAKTTITRKRYVSAFNEGTLDMSVNKAGVQVCKELVVCQPECNKMKNYSAMAWLSYPVKNAGAGRQSVEEFTESDFNTRNGPRQVHGLFQGLPDDERATTVSQFKHKILNSIKAKKTSSVKIIATSNVEKLATEFSARHCPELPYSIENAPELIARMITHVGDVSYRFGQGFFVQRNALKRLQLSKNMDNYHDLIVAEVTETFEKVLNRNMPTTTASLTIKALREELKELKKKWTVKTRGQCHHCHRWSYASRATYYDDHYKWAGVFVENKALKEELEELKIENDRLRKRQSIPDEAVEETFEETTEPERPKKRPRVSRSLHICSACDGCSDESRAGCAQDQGLPVWE